MYILYFPFLYLPRAGLYFLLDKYQELRHQPKLVLLNSIIPSDSEVSKKFKESFERLLTTYVDSQEDEWNPLASVPRFSLHENKVLKQIGVQFYDQEDLNEQKEKELLRLIHNGKFTNYSGTEESFEDLSKIFKQLDEFTAQNIALSFQVDNLDVQQLRQIVLEHLANLLKQDENGSVAIFAEDKTNIDVDTFFYRECMKELFKKDKFIIQGFKGSGKTYLYKALKDKKITEIILGKVGVSNTEAYQFIDIIEVKSATNNFKQFPFPPEEVKSIHNFQAFWKVYLWISTMLDISLKTEFENFRKQFSNSQLEQDIEFLKNATETERKHAFIKYINNDYNLILIEKDLKNLNGYLSSNNIKLFVLFDQLDRVAKLEDWSLFITPLVEFWRDNYNKPTYTNIFPKIFIRTDIITRINTNNSLSLIKTAIIPIEWEPIEIYAYFFKLVFSQPKSQHAFFKLMNEYKHYSHESINHIQNVIKTQNQPPLDQEIIEPLLNTFFGNDIKSPKGNSLGSPFKFFFMNFSNADATFNLRPFINLMSGSINNGLHNRLPKVKKTYTEELIPLFPDLEKNLPFNPILHFAYTTDSDVRDAATKEHFDDLTQEAGNEPLKNTIAYIKSAKIDKKYKKVVLTNFELDNLLEEIINFPEYQMKNKINVSALKHLLIINGIAANDEKYKVYRFAQMYKYWLGLSSRKEDSIQPTQRIKNKVGYISSDRRFGKIFTGYMSSDIFFHVSDFIGDINRLNVDDMVEFVVDRNEKGLIAKNVRKV